MTGLWIIVAGLAGLAMGGIVGFLLADRRCARAADAARQLSAEAGARVEAARQATADREQHLAQARQEAEALRQRASQAEVRAAGLAAQLEAERHNLAEQRRLLAELEGKLPGVFAGVSQEALKKNSDAFIELARSRFETLSKEAEGDLAKKQEQINRDLAPLRLMLDEYQKRLGEIEKARTEDKQQLTSLLATLRDSHQRLDSQTSQLLGALRRPTTRGRWGEITLRRLVELAGMSNYCDFAEQVDVVAGADGKLRPDMVVTLPNERRVVIDSKVPYDSFADGASETDEQRRIELFRAHARAVRARCGELSQKSYQEQFEGTLEFVVMFLPGEAFLYAAVEQDPALIEDALRSKVIIATPTMLIALLKVIEFGWRQQRVADSAAEIQKLGEQLHQRIGVFVEHFARLGKCLDGAAEAYNEAMVSMERNLLTTTQRIEEHGVRSTKEIEPPGGIDTRLEPIGARASAAMARAGLFEEDNPGVDEAPAGSVSTLRAG